MGVGVTCPKCRVSFAFYCSNCKSYDTEIYERSALANYFQARTIYYLKCRNCQFEYDYVFCPAPACNTRILPEETFVKGAKEGDNIKKCFIATACVGKNSQIVKQLCLFRDELLGKNQSGKQFIKYYYMYSPKIASCILRNDLLKSLSKYLIVYPAFYASLVAMKIISYYKNK